MTCGRTAIAMVEDNEGFARPIVNQDVCIGCGQCEKACYANGANIPRKPLKVIVGTSGDKATLNQSSSGGIFSLLSKLVLAQGGVVWGVRWNIEDGIPAAVHDFITEIEDLRFLLGSKYVQSKIGNAYKTVRDQLNQKKLVLFSGTPCQIAGLKCYLRKDYDNLICVEVVCHGVPSPRVLRTYVKEVVSAHPIAIEKVIDVRFRDKLYKNSGWHGLRLIIEVQLSDGVQSVISDRKAEYDPFMRSFLGELINRPSCHKCGFRDLKSGADITLGDFWKVGKYFPKIDDNSGVSIVCVNTEKGVGLINCIESKLRISKEITWLQAVDSTGALMYSPKPHRNRNRFFKAYEQGGVRTTAEKLLKPTKFQIATIYLRKAIERIALIWK